MGVGGCHLPVDAREALGAYWYATASGLVEVPWSRRVVRLLSHEEFVRWAGLPEVPKAGEVDRGTQSKL